MSVSCIAQISWCAAAQQVFLKTWIMAVIYFHSCITSVNVVFQKILGKYVNIICQTQEYIFFQAGGIFNLLYEYSFSTMRFGIG